MTQPVTEVTEATAPAVGTTASDPIVTPPATVPPEGTDPAAPAVVEGAPAEPTKLERAKAAAEQAKRRADVRRKEAARAERDRLERQQLSRELAWERAERERLSGALNSADPAEFLRAKGVRYQDVVQQAINETTPEAQIKALQDRVNGFEQQQVRAAQAAQQQAAYDSFLTQAKDADTYPTLSRLAGNRSATLCRDADDVCARVYQRTGRYPTYTQVLEYLEHEYSNALEQPKSNGASQVAQGTAASESKAANGSRTLTGRTSERALLPRQFEEMTREEQLSFLVRQNKASGG